IAQLSVNAGLAELAGGCNGFASGTAPGRIPRRQALEYVERALQRATVVARPLARFGLDSEQASRLVAGSGGCSPLASALPSRCPIVPAQSLFGPLKVPVRRALGGAPLAEVLGQRNSVLLAHGFEPVARS